MKKFLFLLFGVATFMLSSSTADAQLRTMTGPGLMTNGATAVVGPVQISGYKESVSFMLTVTKGTGTVAGTAVLQGSHDGTIYSTVEGKASVTLTDVATQSFNWTLAPSAYQYYRIQVTTTGTQTSTPTATVLIRR